MSTSKKTRIAGRDVLKPHNFYYEGRRTSVRFEPIVWSALDHIASEKGKSLQQMINEDIEVDLGCGLSSSIRCFIISFLLKRAGYE